MLLVELTLALIAEKSTLHSTLTKWAKSKYIGTFWELGFKAIMLTN